MKGRIKALSWLLALAILTGCSGGGITEPAGHSDGSDIWWYNTLPVDNCLYFSTQGYWDPEKITAPDFRPGLWMYDPAAGKTVTLSEASMNLYRTQTGNYGENMETGEVFRLEGASLIPMGTIPTVTAVNGMTRPGILIDCVEGEIYYHVWQDMRDDQVYVVDAQGNTRLIHDFSQADSPDQREYVGPGFLRDGVYYYQREMVAADVTYGALDMATGAVSTVDFRYPGEGWWPYQIHPNEFYGDGIVCQEYWKPEEDPDGTGKTCYRLDWKDYDTGEVACLWKPDSYITMIHREGNMLYLELSLGSPDGITAPHGRIAELNMVTGEILEREEEIRDIHAWPCAAGCYFEDGETEETDLYFLDYATGEEIPIDG